MVFRGVTSIRQRCEHFTARSDVWQPTAWSLCHYVWPSAATGQKGHGSWTVGFRKVGSWRWKKWELKNLVRDLLADEQAVKLVFLSKCINMWWRKIKLQVVWVPNYINKICGFQSQTQHGRLLIHSMTSHPDLQIYGILSLACYRVTWRTPICLTMMKLEATRTNRTCLGGLALGEITSWGSNGFPRDLHWIRTNKMNFQCLMTKA